MLVGKWRLVLSVFDPFFRDYFDFATFPLIQTPEGKSKDGFPTAKTDRLFHSLEVTNDQNAVIRNLLAFAPKGAPLRFVEAGPLPLSAGASTLDFLKNDYLSSAGHPDTGLAYQCRLVDSSTKEMLCSLSLQGLGWTSTRWNPIIGMTFAYFGFKRE